jgi:hypothetical protein
MLLFCCAGSAASSELQLMRQALQEVLLQPEEVEAAALQCTWLAHYWVRAID